MADSDTPASLQGMNARSAASSYALALPLPDASRLPVLFATVSLLRLAGHETHKAHDGVPETPQVGN
jgi:hypothetical protein